MEHAPVDRSELPDRIGPYKVLDLLGEGGMGTVYLAEQREPVWRRVALKVIKLGMDSREVLRRFEAERQALALMEHPAIAKVFEAGTTPTGQPFFAMEYVRGEPLTRYCDRAKLDLNARLALFLQVCHGVQHAHQKGVVHRDLTPSNVLVAVQDGEAKPKIIDFGLARATDRRLVDGTMFTQVGQVFGTPSYMSPEQAGYGNLDVDTRSDVYTLGVVLFELLTGELPFGRPDSRPASILEMQRRVTEDDPPRPSTSVTVKSGNAQRRSLDDRTLVKRLRGDLDWILLMALERDRGRRYQTASELAADIERHLQNMPVMAGPPGAAYRIRKFVSRYRGQVAAALLLVASLIAGVAGTTWFMFQARHAADEALANLQKFELLANVVNLREARASADRLYPAWPERVPAMTDWIERRGRPLEAVLPQLRTTLAEIRLRAVDPDATERRFEQVGDQFLHDTLERLVADLEAFVDPDHGELADVLRSREWAETITAKSIDAHAARWDEARRAILRADGVTASERYATPAIELAPQLGLVPIGMNPATGLWEFHHLKSAAPDAPTPVHDADGWIEVESGTGIVFVLVPGGVVDIVGDPAAGTDGNELGSRLVSVAPFLIARHELTQAQWTRLSRADNPSLFSPGRQLLQVRQDITDTHPVEQVDWSTCDQLLRRNGLMLPNEAMWEHACRADTTTMWFTGDDPASLQDHANFADRTSMAVMADWGGSPVLEDGWVIHAPVGTFLPNRFGLHDVHGNVWEWCSDAFGASGARVLRGGSHSNTPDRGASGHRGSAPAGLTTSNVGVRAARAIL